MNTTISIIYQKFDIVITELGVAIYDIQEYGDRTLLHRFNTVKELDNFITILSRARQLAAHDWSDD